jgi:hypothetical protein
VQECEAQKGPANSDKLPDQTQKRSEGGEEFPIPSTCKAQGMERI